MTSTTDERTFEVVPITAEKADVLRERGGEVFVADAVPGYPCRQCLRDAAIGEELILVSHDPFQSDSPYRSASPIFLHRTGCGSPALDEAIPLQMTRRQLSVRCFDRNEMMIDAAVIDGEELPQTIGRFLAGDSAERLHVHFAGRGCWAASVTRVERAG